MQGPCNPDLIAAAAASDADLVVFYPYLYHPTVFGVPAVGRRAVMHPAAHDEPPLRMPIFGPVFGGVSGLVFQTWSERRLVERLYPIGATRQVALGLGIEEGPGSPEDAREVFGVGDAPYLIYVGRLDDGKGTGMLARFFATFKERHPGPLKLVLAGSIADEPLPHPDIVVTGPIDEATKWGGLRGSIALVSPGAFEAFSLIVIEGWTAGVPVVVHGRCGPTKEHCERSGGGLWFDGYATFEAVIGRLAADGPLRTELARRGRAYVDAEFRWPTIIKRYAAFLEDVANHL
jgi:glycosyltransferase involved in cell wall biosynthesis